MDWLASLAILQEAAAVDLLVRRHSVGRSGARMSNGYLPDLESEYVTGDQPLNYRKRRGYLRNPKWQEVEKWRGRWTADKVSVVLTMLGHGASAEAIGEAIGFGTLTVQMDQGGIKNVPDLRGLDLALLPPEKRRICAHPASPVNQRLDLSYARLEGSRLTGLDLSRANLFRARLQKATLRRVNFTDAILTKAHLEDADLRDAVLDGTHLGHIRYTEDAFWWRGTVLMETHLDKALYVDPLLERAAKDQYYLYVLKYRNRRNPICRLFFGLWWITCNFGKSPLIWATWSIFLALGFAFVYYQLGEDAFARSKLDWSFPTLVYYSVVTFTTLGFGDVIPKTQEAAWLVMAEVIVGYVMLGGLISIFATKLARRS